MPKLKQKLDSRPEIPIAPMIDVVFLLLIYFMVATSLEKQEADISFQLPGTVEQTEPMDMPDEQIIEITANNQVIINEYPYDSPQAERYLELQGMLTRFKQASEANQVEPSVTISPADSVPHQIIVRVMDAGARAGIHARTFAFSDGA